MYAYNTKSFIHYIESDIREVGYLEDHEGASGFGHGALFVQLNNGNYAFFEIVGLSSDTNGISEYAKSGYVYSDKWGSKTLVLSNSENYFPSKKMSEKLGKPGRSGALYRIFENKVDMFSVLERMGFDETVTFKTTKEKAAIIYETAIESGKEFKDYNLVFNSCGIYANKALTAPGSNINFINENAILFPFSSAIPNIIGGNLLMANPEAKVEKIKKGDIQK